MTGLILALGAPNDKDGNLSTIAQDRLNAVLHILRFNPDYQVLNTGGRGKHFNDTGLPHHYYSRRYLEARGVPAAAFAPTVDSASTLEDFSLSAPLIRAWQPSVLVVVSSDFHMERVKIIQKRLLDYPVVLFWGAASTVPAAELAALQAHEKKAVALLLQQRFI